MKASIVMAALLASSVAFSAQATTNIVLNGGFEDPTQAPGTWSIYNAITGWSTGEGGVEVRNNVAGTAHGGVNYVELDTNFNSGIRQTLNTVVGQNYDLSFWYSPRAGVSAASNPIDVFLNSVLLTSVTGDGAGNSDNIWTNYLFNFIASDTTTNLDFFASGISDSYGGSLDDVSVSAAVPEPETYAMMLAGLGVMGAVARRRNKTVA